MNNLRIEDFLEICLDFGSLKYPFIATSYVIFINLSDFLQYLLLVAGGGRWW